MLFASSAGRETIYHFLVELNQEKREKCFRISMAQEMST